MSDKSPSGVSRRSFLRGSGIAAAATVIPGAGDPAVAAEPPEGEVIAGSKTISLNVNGVAREARVEPRTTLLDVLRYQFDLTGAKPVSGDGSSGASTVLVDGRPVMASTTLALAVRGKEIETVESLGGDRPRCGPSGIRRTRCNAVRLLHAGLCRRRAGVPESASQRRRSPDPARRSMATSAAAAPMPTSSKRPSRLSKDAPNGRHELLLALRRVDAPARKAARPR